MKIHLVFLLIGENKMDNQTKKQLKIIQDKIDKLIDEKQKILQQYYKALSEGRIK
jgi:hypothetical protein